MTIAEYRAYFLSLMKGYSNYLGFTSENITTNDAKVELSIHNSLTISFMPLDGYIGSDGMPIRRKTMILFTFVLEPKAIAWQTQDSIIEMANRIERILDEKATLRVNLTAFEFEIITCTANSASGVVSIIVDYHSSAPELVANP